MPRDDIGKLLGGYATRTLTEQEQKELFEAAIQHQTLFNALADEQALKELLEDPRSRRLLIATLKEKQPRRAWLNNLHAWLQRPSSWALAGGLAVTLLVVTFVVRLTGPLPEPPMTADSGAPVIAPPASPSASETTEPPSQFQSKVRQGQDLKMSKEGKLAARAPQAVAPNVPASVPPSAPSSAQQELRSAAEQSPPEAPPHESFSGLEQSKKSDAGEFAEDKPQPQAPERKALEKAREEVRRFSPMGGPPAKTESTKPEGMTKSELPSLSLRYSILQQDREGKETEVDPSTVFRTGDKARLAIEPNDAGYLYVLARDAAGSSTIIFPPGETTGASARVEKMVRYLIPPADAITFDESGDQWVTIIFSREPLTNFRNLLESETPGEKAVTGKDRDRRAAKAVDPLAPRSDLSSVIKVEIRLKHE